MAAERVGHRFGGAWTELKLDAVEYYMKCYTRALTSARMDTWYIDAFAGPGDREVDREAGGIFEGEPIRTITEVLDGSALRAMKIDPPFNHFIFIEQRPDFCEALNAIKVREKTRDITVLRGDANSELVALMGRSPWNLRDLSRSRGVVFLDPYAMQIDWTTLEALAASRVLDVWYLFPLRDVTRQLANDFSGVGPKAPKLDRMLSPRWRELYNLAEPQADTLGGLFDEPAELKRMATKKQIETWFHGVLGDKFPFVSDPLPILVDGGRHAFSLFLCVSNPAKQATELAEKFVRYVNRNYGPK